MAFAAALSSLQWSVKNTFVHCESPNTTCTSKWNLRSDITASRDHSSMDYLMRIMSPEVEGTLDAYVEADGAVGEATAESKCAPDLVQNIAEESSLTQEEQLIQRVSMSVGASGHTEGECRPCAWNWKPSGCSKGTDCEFCHLCEDGTFKQRRRQKIARLRAEEKAAKREFKAAKAGVQDDVDRKCVSSGPAPCDA